MLGSAEVHIAEMHICTTEQSERERVGGTTYRLHETEQNSEVGSGLIQPKQSGLKVTRQDALFKQNRGEM